MDHQTLINHWNIPEFRVSRQQSSQVVLSIIKVHYWNVQQSSKAAEASRLQTLSENSSTKQSSAVDFNVFKVRESFVIELV